MTAPGLTLDIAQIVVLDDAARVGVELVLPTDPRRKAVAAAVALASPWSLDEVRERVSVTLPSAQALLSPLGAIPGAGPYLAFLARAWGDGRTQIYPSPAAWRDAVECLAMWCHERAHAEQIAKALKAPLGVVRWVAGYAGSPEVRAGGAEGPAYTQDLAVRVLIGGWSVQDAAAAARHALESYALDDEGRVLADAAVGVAERSLAHQAMVGGPVVDVLRALRARGVTVPGWAVG